MRQRLSSEPDRYRGRRRVPTPPRSRYAAVGAAAFVGAGMVALGAGGSLPDAKAVSPSVLKNLEEASLTSPDLADRGDTAERASRSNARGTEVTTKLSTEQAEREMWLLPLDNYEFTSAFGVRWGKLHAGIDLHAPDGTPYKAVHAGKVVQAGYSGGYGYRIVVQQDNGIETIYAHSRRLLVKEGDTVKAGQVIGLVGNTGASYGTHLHLEIHQNGTPIDPISYLQAHGVDIKLQVESVYGNLADAS